MERPRGNPSEYEPPTLDRAAGKPGPRFARPARMARWRRTQRDPDSKNGRAAKPTRLRQSAARPRRATSFPDKPVVL